MSKSIVSLKCRNNVTTTKNKNKMTTTTTNNKVTATDIFSIAAIVCVIVTISATIASVA